MGCFARRARVRCDLTDREAGPLATFPKEVGERGEVWGGLSVRLGREGRAGSLRLPGNVLGWGPFQHPLSFRSSAGWSRRQSLACRSDDGKGL
jgi:hypothetical protein